MSESDRWIFSTPLYTMLNRPTVYQAQWVAKYTDLIFKCVQEFETREQNNMKDLRQYYEPKPKGEQSPMRAPLTPRQPKQSRAQRNLKPAKLMQYFESSISPGERTKRASRTKAANDEKKAQEKRRKAKQKIPGKAQPRLQGFFQPKKPDPTTGIQERCGGA
jgi:hypothetical protein